MANPRTCAKCGASFVPSDNRTLRKLCYTCNPIRHRTRRTPPHNKGVTSGRARVNSDGYAMVYCPVAEREPGREGHTIVQEHRLVMQRKLGRFLLPGENVHHINGDKLDNRPENLELWITHQPKGQRPEDLVAWAHEILRRYQGET